MKRGFGYQITRPARAFGRYSLDAFDWRGVRQGGENIRILWRAVRAPPAMPETPEDGRPYYSRTLQAELWQTAWNARVWWIFAAGTLLLWMVAALTVPGMANWFSGLMALLMVWLFMAKAALNAVQNWQLLTGQTGGLRAFMKKDGPLWPPLPARPK